MINQNIDFLLALVYNKYCIKSWVDAHANLPFPGKVDRRKAM
jgi:hypothetical protein